MILFHEDRSIGRVREEADEYEDVPTMNIGTPAIIPEYQLVIISVYFPTAFNLSSNVNLPIKNTPQLLVLCLTIGVQFSLMSHQPYR